MYAISIPVPVRTITYYLRLPYDRRDNNLLPEDSVLVAYPQDLPKICTSVEMTLCKLSSIFSFVHLSK